MTFEDQLGQSIELPSAPQRIVSLVPSQTELLAHLGLDDRLVGITKFCIHPEHLFRSKPRIGGTKAVDLDKVRALQPDLIIANKEENDRTQVEALSKEFPCWTSDISDLESAIEMIRIVGQLTKKPNESKALAREIEKKFMALNKTTKSKRTLYLIWKDPYMSVGGDTFIHDMIDRCSLENMTGDQKRYPEILPEEFEEPELVLLSSEPYPFKQIHIEELKAFWPKAEFKLVDGEYFSWYGSRLLRAPDYFLSILEN